MKYTQTYNTRENIIFRLFGIVCFLGLGLSIVMSNDSYPPVAVILGTTFILFSLYILHGLIYPTTWVSTISDEEILCTENGIEKFNFKKEELNYISVKFLGENIYIDAYLKDGTSKRIPDAYFMDIYQLIKNLKACGYYVEENI